MNTSEQGKKDIQNIRLSTQEREQILNRILKTPLPSPYQGSWHTWMSVRVSTYALALLLISAGTGSTLTLAAEGSVPGNLLYPLKISISEPIRSVLARSPEDKAVWEVEQIERRLNEAVRLAAKNELTEERALALEKKLRKNTEVEQESMSSFALIDENEKNEQEDEERGADKSPGEERRRELKKGHEEERGDIERLNKLEEVARERINKQRKEMQKVFEERLSERTERAERKRD